VVLIAAEVLTPLFRKAPCSPAGRLLMFGSG
jgi:hypothetical protein